MAWDRTDLETVCCDLCGAFTATPLYTRPDGLQVVQCQCGLAWVNPRPKPDAVYRLYDREYFVKDLRESACGYSDYLSEVNRIGRLDYMEEVLQAILDVAPVGGKRCLEVGCATGEAAAALHDHGATVLGLDLSADAVAVAKERYPHISFRSGVVENLPRDRAFDLIFAFEVIEHVLSPRKFLAELACRLAPGGRLVLTTPNLDCGRRVGYDRWFGLNRCLEHLYFLDSQSLDACATKADLKMIAWYTGMGDGVLFSGMPPASPSRLRVTLRRTAHRLGVLQVLRRLRRKAGLLSPAYRHAGRDHDLLSIFTFDGDQLAPGVT